MWQRTRTLLQKHKFLTTTAVASSVMTVADFNAQMLEGGGLDWRRSGLFFFFGLFNGAVFVFATYGKLMPWLFPRSLDFAGKSFASQRLDTVGQRSVLGQVAVVNGIIIPFGFFPSFYLFKEAVLQILHSSEPFCPERLFEGAWARFTKGFVIDNLWNLAVYIPGDTLCFTMPVWVRLPLANAISFTFNTGFSCLRGQLPRPEAGADQQQEQALRTAHSGAY